MVKRITRKQFAKTIAGTEHVINITTSDLEMLGNNKYAYLFSTDVKTDDRMDLIIESIKTFLKGNIPKKMILAIVQSSKDGLIMDELNPFSDFLSEFSDVTEIKWGYYQSDRGKLRIICMFDDELKIKTSLKERILWSISSLFS